MSSYSHLFGIKVTMFRFANVVGAGMGHGVIFDFIRKLKRNPEELEILGDGNQEKPFFLVEDCISGMICAFKNSKMHIVMFLTSALKPLPPLPESEKSFQKKWD